MPLKVLRASTRGTTFASSSAAGGVFFRAIDLILPRPRVARLKPLRLGHVRRNQVTRDASRNRPPDTVLGPVARRNRSVEGEAHLRPGRHQLAVPDRPR